MKRAVINFVERNIHGVWVVWGIIGSRQYYYHTKAEAMRKYRDEYYKETKIERALAR